MALQQWLFSFKGRIGRRAFWLWIALWIGSMLLLFALADWNVLSLQSAAFMLVCLLWPTAAVIIKRLHDRGRSGAWALLFVLSWMLLAGNWQVLPSLVAWAVGRLVPVVILIGLLIELGALSGTQGENRYGKQTQPLNWR
ncbi:hypothetical protein TUM12370_00820 [Salmonella enterica subsp. enterica serovar Choleraesuis]|nr:hypothetical protein TUM12370_00820 [Salmonella enterica subsp. enterica serovar Choleraesuis]